MRNIKKVILLALSALSVSAMAEDDIKSDMFNPVNTGVTTLSIAPDARASSLGNLGAVTVRAV